VLTGKTSSIGVGNPLPAALPGPPTPVEGAGHGEDEESVCQLSEG